MIISRINEFNILLNDYYNSSCTYCQKLFTADKLSYWGLKWDRNGDVCEDCYTAVYQGAGNFKHYSVPDINICDWILFASDIEFNAIVNTMFLVNCNPFRVNYGNIMIGKFSYTFYSYSFNIIYKSIHEMIEDVQLWVSDVPKNYKIDDLRPMYKKEMPELK